MSSSTVVYSYFITGANRGIGFALVNDILSRHADVAVFAGARDPAAATALKELEVKYPGKLHIVKHVAENVASNQAVAKAIQDAYGRVDTVIANAEIANVVKPLLVTPPEAFAEHFAVNVISLVILF